VTAIAPDQRPSTSDPSGTTASRPERSQTAAVDGAFRIQLAAVRDEADARRAWDLFQVDLGPVLSGLEPFIERADTANGVFYRVQIGSFASLQEAEALCDELKQRNASCFVIRR
jgi:cell division septation protein DedD